MDPILEDLRTSLYELSEFTAPYLQAQTSDGKAVPINLCRGPGSTDLIIKYLSSTWKRLEISQSLKEESIIWRADVEGLKNALRNPCDACREARHGESWAGKNFNCWSCRSSIASAAIRLEALATVHIDKLHAEDCERRNGYEECNKMKNELNFRTSELEDSTKRNGAQSKSLEERDVTIRKLKQTIASLKRNAASTSTSILKLSDDLENLKVLHTDKDSAGKRVRILTELYDAIGKLLESGSTNVPDQEVVGFKEKRVRALLERSDHATGTTAEAVALQAWSQICADNVKGLASVPIPGEDSPSPVVSALACKSMPKLRKAFEAYCNALIAQDNKDTLDKAETLYTEVWHLRGLDKDEDAEWRLAAGGRLCEVMVKQKRDVEAAILYARIARLWASKEGSGSLKEAAESALSATRL